jgi:hypothetical protein
MQTQQLLWVQQLIQDVLGHRFQGHLVCDNELSIKLSKDDGSSKRTRHTKQEFFITNQALFITNQELFEDKASLKWTPTEKQLADILTKALSPEKHETLAQQVLGSLPSQQGGGVLGHRHIHICPYPILVNCGADKLVHRLFIACVSPCNA